jgi:hypothetical protein
VPVITVHPLLPFIQLGNRNLTKFGNNYTSSAINLIELKSIFAKSTHTNRMVVMEEDSSLGYSNKFYTFMNCFYVAVTKKSSLFINWKNVDQYIKTPFPSGFYLNEPQIFENRTQNKSLRVNDVRVATKNAWQSVKNASLLYQALPTGFDVYTIPIYHAIFFELASNPIHFDTLLELGLVSQEVISQAKILYKLEKTKPVDNSIKVEVLYAIGYSLAHNTLKNIWVPNESKQLLINEYVEANFKSKYVIGMQMRFGFMKKPNDVTSFVNCALEHEKHVTERLQIHGSSIRWFIAGDNEDDLESIRKGYPDRVITLNGSIGHISFTEVNYQRAIMDNELLSRCNELIITGGSTYGAVAAMRSGRLPLFFNVELNSTGCPRMNFTDLPKRGVKAGDLAIFKKR